MEADILSVALWSTAKFDSCHVSNLDSIQSETG